MFRSVRKGRNSRVSIEGKATCYALLKISTDIKMPAQWREALASRKLNPCFTLIIFSFMVSFTLSIMDLTLRINSLHLPVLVMWLITLCSVLLTVIFWYCHSSISSVGSNDPEISDRRRHLLNATETLGEVKRLLHQNWNFPAKRRTQVCYVNEKRY